MGVCAVSDLYTELAKALGEISKGDGWASVRELSARSGRNKWAVRDWLRGEVEAGRVEVGVGHDVKMTGVRHAIPVYRVKGAKRGKG